MRLKFLEILQKLYLFQFSPESLPTLSQAVYLLHASLGHMPKSALIALAKSASEEQTDSELLSSMVMKWPTALTPEVIRDHFP